MNNGPNYTTSDFGGGTFQDLQLAVALLTGGGDTGGASPEDPTKERKQDADKESQE